MVSAAIAHTLAVRRGERRRHALRTAHQQEGNVAGAEFPTAPAQLTPQWLTHALRTSGAARTSSVASYDAKIIGEGTGFLGELAHLTLRYDKPEPGAPSTLIAKFPTAAPENREMAMYFRFYERETGFYEHIASQVQLRTPRCYFNAFKPENGDFLLLLEDLAPATCGDQVAGCSVEHVRLAIHELAKFQATWWNSPKLDGLEWIPRFDAEWQIDALEQNYEPCWPAFVDFVGPLLTPILNDAGVRLGKSARSLMNRMASDFPMTIVHGDYRLDNMFFASSQGGPEFAVIDWQIAQRSTGVFDVAYFLAGTLPSDERRAHEREILRSYHNTLVAHGVNGYSFDQCWQDYRTTTLFLFVYSVMAAGSIDMANERGATLFSTIARRTLSAIDDLKAYEMLD
jgi:hypothetical protein